jgi:hypothetical protein
MFSFAAVLKEEDKFKGKRVSLSVGIKKDASVYEASRIFLPQRH